MNTRIDRRQTSMEKIDRWRDRVARRMRAHDARRPPFNRQQFVTEYSEDHPGDPHAVELADAFEAAIAAAHGNPARFERELGRLIA
jgi:hypothetical protein